MTDGTLWDTDPPSTPAEGGSAISPVVPATSWSGFPPVDGQVRPCRQPLCRCTHDNGCEFGWIDAGLDAVRPCPTCRPDLARRHDETRAQWLHRLRRRRKAD